MTSCRWTRPIHTCSACKQPTDRQPDKHYPDRAGRRLTASAVRRAIILLEEQMRGNSFVQALSGIQPLFNTRLAFITMHNSVADTLSGLRH